MFQRHSDPNGWAAEEEVYGELENMQELNFNVHAGMPLALSCWPMASWFDILAT